MSATRSTCFIPWPRGPRWCEDGDGLESARNAARRGGHSGQAHRPCAQKNARILVATYQTLDVDTADADANFLTTHYPENYFSPIVIDECHRSAWGKWPQVLTRNAEAVQIGLTATPRKLEVTEDASSQIARRSGSAMIEVAGGEGR